MERFGERFRQWRKSRNVSTSWIEEKSDLPTSNLSKIENSKRSVSDNDLHKLASVSELEVDYDTLKAWLALERFTERQLLEAVSVLYPEPEQREAAFARFLAQKSSRKNDQS